MFGIDDLVIGGLIASIVGAGMQYGSATSAAKKSSQASLDAIRRQQEFQRQAEQAAMDNAEDYRTENRMEKQQEIQDRLEQEYSAPALDAQSINAQAATTQGDVSGDYTAAKAASDANVESLAKKFSRLMAKTDSAKQLRTNEAYKIADTASNIGRLQNFSQGQSAVDQMKIQEAANSGSGMNFLGQILSAAGSYGMMSGAGTAAKTVSPGVMNSPTYNGYIGQMRRGLF